MDYPTPDSSLTESGNKRKHPATEGEAAGAIVKKRKEWVFTPLVYSGPHNPTSDLCQRCQTIDFEAIFQLKITRAEGEPVFAFDESTISTIACCPMCHFLAGQPLRRTSRTGCHLRAYRSWSLVADRLKPHEKREFGVVLALCSGPPRKPGPTLCNKGGWGAVLVPSINATRSSSSRKSCMEGHRLFRTSFDFAPLKASLDLCIDTHQCAPRTAPETPSSTKFIDCESREIISLPRGAKYITLSYVWGRQKPSQEVARFIRASKCLPHRIPQTIEDAIVVALSAQQRYLWVDRYCINQYQSDEKHAQISAMADIYEGALFTIVGLGYDADSGLPGISRPFGAQLRFEIRGREYMSTGPTLQHYLERSEWRKRAWVYQEAVLSRRCLFLTPDQAFLTCLRGTASETLPTPIPCDLQNELPWDRNYFNPSMITPPEQRARKTRVNKSTLQAHLTAYRTRSMTYRSDALNAFKGILTRSGLLSWWGVPLRPDVRTTENELIAGFTCGLCWVVRPETKLLTTPGSSACDFPSWSWVSHASRSIELECPLNLYSDQLYWTTVYCPELSVTAKDGAELVRFQEFAKHNTHSLLPESARIMVITTYTMKLHQDLPTYSRNGFCDLEGQSNVSGHAYYDYARDPASHQAWMSATLLLLGICVPSHHSMVDEVDFSIFKDLYVRCRWLMVEEFEGKPARRLGVVFTRHWGVNKCALSRRTIELG